MNNAEIFSQTFGIYATELWAKPEGEFLKWLNAECDDQWIPCSERLPEVGEDVFISVGERVCEAHLRASGDYFLTHKIKELVRVRSVDAWMPLPKPYEGRTE